MWKKTDHKGSRNNVSVVTFFLLCKQLKKLTISVGLKKKAFRQHGTTKQGPIVNQVLNLDQDDASNEVFKGAWR